MPCTWKRPSSVDSKPKGKLALAAAGIADDRHGYLYAGFGERWLNQRCGPALDWYEKAYTLTPNYYPITKELAECHDELGEEDLAIAALERYLEIEVEGRGHDQASSQLASLRKP